MFRIACASLLATLCVLFAVPALAAADRYPERPIRMIVPFAPGGGTDITARILAEPMGQALGETIVVDNRPGAASIIGCEIAAKSTPDGHTLLLASTSLTVNSVIYRKIPFDVQRDLIAITRVSDQPSILVTHPSFPAKTFKDFVALVQSQPGKFTFGTPGYGTATHLASEQLLQKIKADLIQVPFKGTGPALTALLSQEITVYLSTFASALPHVKQGRLRAYGVTTKTRAGPLPDVPTLAEQGVEGYEYASWYGLFAPAGTPQNIINKLNRAAVDSLKSEKVLAVFEKQGLNATPTTPEQFAQYIASERRKWTDVVRFAKIEQR
ncbi:MAG: tripartite tricarboxylate transporter substrate binding protein [Betaproteobacteria bacterium]|nr:tripartite tricarboxylate transporter substrate binding protein [Betaproteobacteria bacterium]